MLSDAVLAGLQRAGLETSTAAARAVGGGSISRTLKLDTARGPVLLKLETCGWSDLLDAEAAGLAALRDARAIAVPAVLATGCTDDEAYLALEWIDFGARSAAAQRRLGTELAVLHRHTTGDFGWHRDNYIGRTPQPNERSSNWTTFFRERRLAFQLELADRNGLGKQAQALGRALLDKLDVLLDGHAPRPSLLHGDLWGGNWGATPSGVPYLFDPAAYFGDREADLAMTRLFGGFGAEFYSAYEDVWPLPDGWQERVGLYNLYHVLNHFNLFGGAYAGQALAMLRRLSS